jgi:triosephosphate isomerase
MHLPFYIIGNWKSNKTVDEAVTWMTDFRTLYKKQPFDNKKVHVILCPSDIHLTTLRSMIQLSQLPIHLGMQNLSFFESGAYTGEVAAAQAHDLVNYAIIGHSERRKYFGETDEKLIDKVKQAKESGIEPVYCVQEGHMSVPEHVSFVAYEPVWAIGTGKPATPEQAEEAAKKLLQSSGRELVVIYGGSVTDENVKDYAKLENVSGVLPGGASLKADAFYRMILNAQG